MADIELEIDDIARMLGLRDMQIETLQKKVSQLAAPEPEGPTPIDIEAHRAPPEEGTPAA